MRRAILALCMVASLSLAACGADGATKPPSQAEQVQKRAAKSRAYLPTHGVELRNYNGAQRTYDDPANILWCTFSFTNQSSPLVTVPVSGKLTSSSVSFFRTQEEDWGLLVEKRSVDGMFHGSPPPYRYGFTPGGAYVDFSNLATYCSNKPTKFQRQSTKVSLEVDPNLGSADIRAQKALRAGHKAEADRILNAAIGG